MIAHLFLFYNQFIPVSNPWVQRLNIDDSAITNEHNFVILLFLFPDYFSKYCAQSCRSRIKCIRENLATSSTAENDHKDNEWQVMQKLEFIQQNVKKLTKWIFQKSKSGTMIFPLCWTCCAILSTWGNNQEKETCYGSLDLTELSIYMNFNVQKPIFFHFSKYI